MCMIAHGWHARYGQWLGWTVLSETASLSVVATLRGPQGRGHGFELPRELPFLSRNTLQEVFLLHSWKVLKRLLLLRERCTKCFLSLVYGAERENLVRERGTKRGLSFCDESCGKSILASWKMPEYRLYVMKGTERDANCFWRMVQKCKKFTSWEMDNERRSLLRETCGKGDIGFMNSA